MRLVLLPTACLIGLALTPALAAERALTAAETTALLAGNTVLGQSSKGPTRQFFNANGDTDYVAADGSPSKGRWRMEGDRYCSVWPPQDRWTCYAVSGDRDASPPTIVWTDAAGFASRGSIKTGKALE